MTTLFGTSTTGANLQFEMQTGAHERLLVTPLSRSSLLVGRSLKEMVPLVAQAVIVILVMLPFGFRADPVGAPIGLAMLAVLGRRARARSATRWRSRCASRSGCSGSCSRPCCSRC